jgi:hypothetical protein
MSWGKKDDVRNERTAMTLLAGYGERVITPPLGLDLSGYGFYLDRKAASVLDDLKVRVLGLTSGGRTLVLAACDLIGFTVEFSDAVRTDVAAALRVPLSHVLLACTHTHSGPATQPLPGLGEMDPAFMNVVRKRIRGAADDAAADLREAKFAASFNAIEAIGYNRRTNDFRGIDPTLGTAVFRRKDRTIYLFNYACHPVVFGPRTHVSADWPGAVIREIEKGGNRALFLQGFCGDIDPVTQLNRWGEGTVEDLELYGHLLARRLEKAERSADVEPEVPLAAAEWRLVLPLRVYGPREVERVADDFEKSNAHFPGAGRFASAWRTIARKRAASFRKKPYLENVPVQVLSIGRVKLLAFPGEVFCKIGLKLRAFREKLIPVGYANGSIGYIPTRKAFRDPQDYACWYAPMFYQTFPFSEDIEGIFLRAGRRLLRDCSSKD